MLTCRLINLLTAYHVRKPILKLSSHWGRLARQRKLPLDLGGHLDEYPQTVQPLAELLVIQSSQTKMRRPRKYSRLFIETVVTSKIWIPPNVKLHSGAC